MTLSVRITQREQTPSEGVFSEQLTSTRLNSIYTLNKGAIDKKSHASHKLISFHAAKPVSLYKRFLKLLP
jgi:hypothetical protein